MVQDIHDIPTDVMVTELYERGVTIADVFGQFYALEEQASHLHETIHGNDEEGQHGRKPLTVGDAELAGLTRLPEQPLPRQPF